MRQNRRFYRFARDAITRTPIVKMIFLLLGLWLAFATALYFSERGEAGAAIVTYVDALYWTVAAFSTAGIADTPLGGLSKLIGGLWSIIGSVLFFGTIVATITAYFMRPMLRPVHQIVETIEYNLEQLDDLSVDELDILKATTDSLIVHMERHKKYQDRHKKKSISD